jgi:hypothetical protein
VDLEALKAFLNAFNIADGEWAQVEPGVAGSVDMTDRQVLTGRMMVGAEGAKLQPVTETDEDAHQKVSS